MELINFKNFITPNNQELGNWFHSFAAKTSTDCFAVSMLSPSLFIDLTLQSKLEANSGFRWFTCVCAIAMALIVFWKLGSC